MVKYVNRGKGYTIFGAYCPETGQATSREISRNSGRGVSTMPRGRPPKPTALKIDYNIVLDVILVTHKPSSFINR